MKVAILGLGIIGEAWAKNLEDDKVPLLLWNRTPKERANFVADPVEAVRRATHIFLVVSDANAVAATLDRIVPVLRPGQVVIQSSTITPAAVKAAAEAVALSGAHFLDAPFTGSKPAAEQRQTVFYVGGDAAALEVARPVMERLSRLILPVGGVGAASALKLAMNLNLAQMAQALTESLCLARSAGITDEIFFAALKANVGWSGLAELKEPKIRADDYTPQFSVKNMHKDLRQAKEFAGRRAFPQLETLYALYEAAMSRNFGEDDFISLIRLLARPRTPDNPPVVLPAA